MTTTGKAILKRMNTELIRGNFLKIIHFESSMMEDFYPKVCFPEKTMITCRVKPDWYCVEYEVFFESLKGILDKTRPIGRVKGTKDD